jgi:hypothetical protein
MSQKEVLHRVTDGLFHLTEGLKPFVQAHMQQKFGPSWLASASRSVGSGSNDQLDVYGLLKTMTDKWQEVFGELFDRSKRHTVRSFVTTALDARNNAVAHYTFISDAEALRYLDAMHHLLQAVGAPQADTQELARLYKEQRMSEATDERAPVQAAPPPPLPNITLVPKPAQARPADDSGDIVRRPVEKHSNLPPPAARSV